MAKIKADIALDEDGNVLEVHKQKPKHYIRIEIEESELPDLEKVTSVYDKKKNIFVNKVKPIEIEQKGDLDGMD